MHFRINISEFVSSFMEKISFFLEKFKTVGLDSVLVRETFIKEVERILHTALEPHDVTFKEGVLYITAKPALKSELYLKRRLFLTELSKTLGPTKIIGLR